MATQIQKLNTKVIALKEIRLKLQELESKADEYKVQRDILQEELLGELQKNELKQWKTDDMTVSRISKDIVRIVDEGALISDMREKGLENYIDTKVNSTFKNTYLPKAVKGGDKFAGIESDTKEYLSVRVANQKENE